MKRVRIILAALASALVAAGAVLVQRRSRFRRDVQQIWKNLETTYPSKERFSPEMVKDLPEPVQRYFTHAIAPGTPLAASATLTMHGQIKLGGRWNPFTARQVLAPFRGFVWSTRATMGPVWLEGADVCTQGYGRMHFDMFGMIPMIDVTGDDVRRSALGRLVGESSWLPAALLPQRGVQWEAVDDTHINATVTLDGETVTARLTIDAAGRLVSLVLDRWNTDEQCYLPFGFVALEEATYGGYTIASRGHAGWWYGTDRYEREGRFFECTIEQASYR
jgi:hypothetical protein